MLRKLAYTIFTLAVVSVAASAVPFAGYRTTDPADTLNYGVYGASGWSHDSGGLMITWNITDNLNGTWTYQYCLTDENGDTLTKTPSHLIVELSDLNVVLQPDTLETRADWSQLPNGKGPDPSNPGIPGPLLGVKLEWGSTNCVQFTADREPKWGDFYARDGKDGGDDVYAYNLGFGTDPTVTTTDFLPWIAVPDTEGGSPPQDIIPEPATVTLLGLGLGGLFLRRKRKLA